jgi:tetratricopeptide (TPR) repeat protein
MIRYLLMVVLAVGGTVAQGQTTDSLRREATSMLKAGDYGNAMILLSKALAAEPNNADIRKELAMACYHGGYFKQGYDAVKPLVEKNDADEQAFQITGMLCKESGDLKEAERIYKAGIKKFPGYGPLYADYGEMLEQRRPGYGDAANVWEKGIEMTPSYPGNYYHAARYYASQDEWIWAVVYGEVFVNLESYSVRTPEIKELLYDGYQKLMGGGLRLKMKSSFEKEVANIFTQQGDLINKGVNPETLVAIRTRFILNWFDGPGKKMPYRLYDMHRLLLQEGLFEAYNQWLFGSVADLPAYQNWTSRHSDVMKAFYEYQRARVFQIPAGQYYKF